MFLKKGSEAFDKPNKMSQSHGHALADVEVSHISSKYYPWHEIEAIDQEFMSIKIDSNYPGWFVHADDCFMDVLPPPVIPAGAITNEQAAQAVVTLLRWFKQ